MMRTICALVAVGGLAVAVGGVWLWSESAGYVVGGCMLFALAELYGHSIGKRKP